MKNAVQWNNTITSPVPPIWGEPIEICYKESGSVIKDTGFEKI